MGLFELYGVAALTVWVMVTTLWAISVPTKDASIIDMFWGPLFVAIAWVLLPVYGGGVQAKPYLVMLLVTLWGLRLAYHLIGRNLGAGEDVRYARWRASGGPKWWLWVFTNKEGTVYEVHNGRGRAVIEDFLEDFKGVLVSDCLNIYDGVTALQQKCYAHHLKAISAAIEEKGFPEQGYLIKVRSMLKTALLIKGLNLPQAKCKECKAALEQTADRLLQPSRDDPVEEKVRNRLFKQRSHLFTFLDFESVEATNNLAERQLRPAVIARKLSCGNKTEKGAQSWQIITSLAATCRQTGKDFAEFVSERMTLQPAR